MMSSATEGPVLVTGASGFVGSAVLRRCAAEGLQCVAFSRRPSMIPNVTVHTGDVTDPESVRRAMRGARAVVHAAGLVHQRWGTPRAQYDHVNVEGTRVVIEAAVESGVNRLVLISSTAIYGRGGDAPQEDSPPKPTTPYGASKYAAERLALALSAQRGMALTIVRPATVVGEGDQGSVAALARLLYQRRFVWIGDGSNRKTLIDVDDLAVVCTRVIGSGQASGAVYNVGGWRVSMQGIVETLARALGVPVSRHGVPVRLARGAVALTAPLSRLTRIGGAQDRLNAWLSDDVYDASRYESHFGSAACTPWRETLTREADWLQHQWRRSAVVGPDAL